MRCLMIEEETAETIKEMINELLHKEWLQQMLFDYFQMFVKYGGVYAHKTIFIKEQLNIRLVN